MLTVPWLCPPLLWLQDRFLLQQQGSCVPSEPSQEPASFPGLAAGHWASPAAPPSVPASLDSKQWTDLCLNPRVAAPNCIAFRRVPSHLSLFPCLCSGNNNCIYLPWRVSEYRAQHRARAP